MQDAEATLMGDTGIGCGACKEKSHIGGASIWLEAEGGTGQSSSSRGRLPSSAVSLLGFGHFNTS